ncbi:hypothetical protein Bcer98_1605 [Bacillus cytotoxicus NVH 391-98]|uniref:Uncharacterized protein n=1 Tax=Bacillus cytotoxicus (strain DSM 22905 / CIP 110041 / 391-98 / NVH 391-98) TaxID=315749 RepID=A7GP56_BACCN|nr:hypothetical protein [Bacillus cytotoxicus]ABS21914.1 hypothetical protein Bcer98_1605 [Bacillus cytotoxicus NVH 391-98]AWC44603.1 hypothetical protein CG479_008735 [Bacillus cytotoxicus]MDH2863276.1 hypothetical protein [Bacillus cytotoxicus]MDH2882795.1 hypothetical protein [Bacillus cytotoxicus]MDH2889998.1 hypothetical protein [Bacillus cytotoxicus]
MKKVEIFDPAAHVNYVMHGELGNITISRMDPKVEVENDRKEAVEQGKNIFTIAPVDEIVQGRLQLGY